MSCDTDLAEPVRLVTQEFGLPFCVIPTRTRSPKTLKDVATGVRHLNRNRLNQSRFPDEITTSNSKIVKARILVERTPALRDGRPYMAFGTPGGDQQDQWSLHVFLRHVHFGMNLQAAIDAPAFHTEYAPSSFYPRGARPGHLAMEGRFSTATVEELRRRGHEVELRDGWSLGRVVAVAKDGEILCAAANPRFMQNYAVGR